MAGPRSTRKASISGAEDDMRCYRLLVAVLWQFCALLLAVPAQAQLAPGPTHIAAELVALGGAAVATLAELMRPGVKPDVRLRAATSVLSLGAKLRAQTWEERLVALERARVQIDMVTAQFSAIFEVDE